MADYTVKRIDEMEGAYGGAFKRARAELGVSSFGMAIVDMPPNFEHYPTHDHASDGQEEVFMALRGSAEIDIAGERVQLDADHVVRVAAGTDGNGTLETVFVREDGEEIGRNRQAFFVEPGKFGYRLVRGELDFPGPGTVEAKCTIVESGSAVTVPLTALASP